MCAVPEAAASVAQRGARRRAARCPSSAAASVTRCGARRRAARCPSSAVTFVALFAAFVATKLLSFSSTYNNTTAKTCRGTRGCSTGCWTTSPCCHALSLSLSTRDSSPSSSGGHGKLARQMTLLLAFCDYLGNAVKDLVSAPRPCSPPGKRVTATEDEKENAMEYGLPSSHALNTVCLMGYMLHYVLTYGPCDGFTIATGFPLAFMLVTLIGIARVYLSMHSLTDVIAGISFGVVIHSGWWSMIMLMPLSSLAKMLEYLEERRLKDPRVVELCQGHC